MRAFLAKCAAVALIAGGFALTGDAGRLLARSRGVIEATTIPQMRETASPPAPSAATNDGRSPHPTPAPSWDDPGFTGPEPESSQRSESAAAPPADAPVGSAAAAPLPDGKGLATVSIASLSPGDRILVWVGGPSAPLAYDIVDPATGDAIELRHAGGDDRLSAHAPRRRVRLEGSARRGSFARAASPTDAGRIDVGRLLRLSAVDSRAGSPGAAAQETIGPVVAIEVVPPTVSP